MKYLHQLILCCIFSITTYSQQTCNTANTLYEEIGGKLFIDPELADLTDNW